MIRRIIGWTINQSSRFLLGTVWRLGGQTALDSAVGAAVEAVPKSTQRSHRQIFNIHPGITVYVRGSHCTITVQHHAEPKVILDANLYRAFGVELVAEQDEAGVYIIAKRKAVLGNITRADLTLTVPADCQLAFHLTPGEVTFKTIDGVVKLPAKHIFSAED